MSEMTRIPFFKLLNLEAITPVNESSKILESHTSILSSQFKNLLEKNNSIKTGYEHFYIKKGTTKLFPFIDFDFIGKHVVCQKCCQKFASKLSYRAHVGTDICVRTYNGPNLVYLKYKNRNCKQVRKRNKNKLVRDLHDIKKNLLNSEMLNTLQTRNNCYSDIVYRPNKVKEKHENISNKNDVSSIKKPRGRPRKNIEVNTKKRGRPKKFNTFINNEIKSIKTEIKKEPRISSVCNVDDDAYNNNVNENEKVKLLLSKMKILTDKFWTLVITEWKQDDDFDLYKNPVKHENQIQYNDGEKSYFHNLETLEKELKLISKQFQGKNEYSYIDEIESMLSTLIEKRNEYNHRIQKNTNMNNELAENDGKENIQCTIINNEDETELNLNKMDCDPNVEIVNVWTSNDNRDSAIVLNNSSESTDATDMKNTQEQLVCEKIFKKTSNEDMTPKCINSFSKNYTKNFLECEVCDKRFMSIAEWKMHHEEHLVLVNKIFLCKICGLKFKMYKNFIKHVNIHGKIKLNSVDDNSFKKFVCTTCYEEYDELGLYFSHIKTHNK